MDYVGRTDWILERLAGKTVLHLGFVGTTCEEGQYRLAAFNDSLHATLMRTTKRVVGVDIEAEIVTTLTEQGVSDLFVGDVEALTQSAVPRDDFDVVLLGDLIEHLSNPGLMLDEIRVFLGHGGELIVTTPNAFSLPAFVRFVAGRFREGDQHVLSFNAYTLANLLRRHGWAVTETQTCYQDRTRRERSRLGFRVGEWVLRRFPRFGGTLLVTARPD